MCNNCESAIVRIRQVIADLCLRYPEIRKTPVFISGTGVFLMVWWLLC